MNRPSGKPGWDKQAVNQIARDQYGGLGGMFEAHGWAIDGRIVSQIAPTRVVQTYGSVEAFVRAHEDGRSENPVLESLAMLKEGKLQVFLTSYFDFTPYDWPCLSFTDEGRRDRVCKDTKPGFFAAIYGSVSGQTPPEKRGRIIGIYQCSHEIGQLSDFISPTGMKRKLVAQKNEKSWNYAIRAIRAWRVALDSAPLVSEFAPQTYSPQRGTTISRFGKWLLPDEARNILKLDLIPEPVFGGSESVESVLAAAEVALKPSRPGPVSQSSYMVREAEGPKHLYVLRLAGSEDHFLGEPANGCAIVKVGFSKSPETRCHAHNQVMPDGAFRWHVIKSTLAENECAFPSSRHALAGEQEMIRLLTDSGKSLGGEFFLAAESAIEAAWAAGKRTAGSVAK